MWKNIKDKPKKKAKILVNHDVETEIKHKIKNIAKFNKIKKINNFLKKGFSFLWINAKIATIEKNIGIKINNKSNSNILYVMEISSFIANKKASKARGGYFIEALEDWKLIKAKDPARK